MEKNKRTKQDPVGLPFEPVEQRIVLIRGHKVLLDSDLAAMYGVELRTLNQAVKRNRNRFPADFMFQVSRQEHEILRSQFVTSSWGGRRYRPYAFTEHGVAMLSSVLRSEHAVAVNIQIIRTFVRLRELLSTHKELARKLDELEARYDDQFAVVFDAIRKLMEPPPIGKKRRIGFL